MYALRWPEAWPQTDTLPLRSLGTLRLAELKSIGDPLTPWSAFGANETSDWQPRRASPPSRQFRRNDVAYSADAAVQLRWVTALRQ